MTCNSCKRPIPPKARVCPHCGAKPGRAQSKRKQTTADVVEGILFLLFGVVLAGLFTVRFINVLEPAMQQLATLPKGTVIGDYLWVAETRYRALPAILVPFSHLMWLLAGVFLFCGGLFSVISGKGLRQGWAAVVLMLFGLGTDILAVFVRVNDSGAVTSASLSLASIFAEDRPGYIVRLVVITAAILLCAIKARAKRKQRFHAEAARVRQRNQRRAAARTTAKAPANGAAAGTSKMVYRAPAKPAATIPAAAPAPAPPQPMETPKAPPKGEHDGAL